MSKAERITEIARMMAAGPFDRSDLRELAKDWGLSESALHTYAQEASRRVKAAVPDDEYRTACLADLDAIKERAMASNDPKALAVAVKAIEVRLRARGLLTQRHEVQQIQPMSPAELVDAIATDPQLRPLIEARLAATPTPKAMEAVYEPAEETH